MLFSEFIEKYKEDLIFEVLDTTVIDEDWKYWKWECVISFKGLDMTFDYFGGMAVSEPTLEDVLISFISDYHCVVDRDLVDFLCELGYTDGADSVRKGEECYYACIEQTRKVRRLFGDWFDELAECEE